MSIVCEAWLRTEIYDGRAAPWSEYSAVLLYLSGAAGLVTLVLSLVVVPLQPISWLGAIAVLASTYRTGARYYALRMGLSRYVLPADILGIIVTAAVWTLTSLFTVQNLFTIAGAWALGAIFAATASIPPRLRSPRVVRVWLSAHGKHIRPLLRDSVITDLGGIGTPYALAPLMGLAQFGIYRAVSNAAAPIRLVLNPLRPLISSTRISVHRSPKVVGIITLSGILLGGLCWLFLTIIERSGISLGSLSELAVYAIPTSVFVAGSFLLQYYSIVARTHLAGRSLLVGRVAQTALGIVLPIAAALLWGLPGAIWFYSIAILMSGIVWCGMILRKKGPSATNAT